MDVLKLDPDTLLPTDLVENYSSMVWTERHVEDGEFELRTAKVAETREFLPEDTLISHLETDEVMKVETHTIEKDENNNDILLLTGRAVKAPLLEDRPMVGYQYGKEWNAYQYYTNAEVITAVLWNYLINDSGWNALLGSGPLNPAYRVPNLVITDSTSLSEDQRLWFFKDGDMYPQLKELLAVHNFGLRSIRPIGGSGDVVSLDTTVLSSSRGLRTLTPTSDIQQLRLDLYQGVDRTRGQSVNMPVVFSYEFGDIDDPSYLFSSRNLKNMAIARSSLSTREVWADTGGLTPPAVVPTGADLRILYFDGGEPDAQEPEPFEFTPYPEPIPYPEGATQAEMDEIDAENAQNNAEVDADNQQKMDAHTKAVAAYQQRLVEFEAEVVEKALLELKKYNREIIFDGAISPLSTYKYREQYFLGDKVTLSAEYGVEKTMIVSEYVRTEDQTGDRGYPTLVLAN